MRGRSPAAFVGSASLVMALAAGCQPDRVPPPSVSGSPPAASNESPTVRSDVKVQTFEPSGRAHLVELLEETSWSHAVVLPARPISPQTWAGDGHWHARTTYLRSGRRATVIQAGSGGLPVGRLVRLRGTDGILSDGNLYWLERGFTIALAPGDRDLARALTWVAIDPG